MKTNKALPAAEALFITWAMMRMCSIAPTHILSVILFILFFYVIDAINKKIQREQIKIYGKRVRSGLSIIFTFLYTAGGMEQLWAGLDNAIFRVAILGVSVIGMYLLFRRLLWILFYYEEKFIPIEKGSISAKMPIYAAIFCVLSWIPYFLKNFPGIMTIDSMNQYAQIIGVYSPNNHHPWVHTKIIELFYTIGLKITGNPTLSIAFYTVFQMLFLGVCIFYLVSTLQKEKVRRGLLLAAVLFYAWMPYNAIYAVTMWKDPMFAGCVLLYVIASFRILQRMRGEETKTSYRDWIVFAVSGLGMSLLRSNGYYAFLLCIPFFIFAAQKPWRKKMAAVQLMMLLGVFLIKGPIMEKYGVIQPDLVESLSIPAQQISKVIAADKPLTQEQNTFLDNILDTSRIPELYNPYVSDGFKRLVREGNPEYLREHFKEFVKVYCQIGLKYPKEYLIAFRDQSIGYWFPMQEGLTAADEGVIANEFGIENRPFIKGKIVVKLQEIILKLKEMIPGYGILWSMGAVTWMVLLCAGIVLAKKRTDKLLCFLPNFAILLTLIIAAPVAKDFRYFYAMVYCMPFYIILSLQKDTLG